MTLRERTSSSKMSYRRRIETGEAFLRAVRIIGVSRHDVACLIQPRNLFRRKRPTDGAKIVAQLSFVACADDDGGYGRAGEQPRQRDLRNALADFVSDALQSIDDVVEPLDRIL